MFDASDIKRITSYSLDFVRFGAIAGFIAAATILINLNHKAFVKVLGEKSKSFWWLFVFLAIIPFLFTLYIFSLLFGRFFPSQARM